MPQPARALANPQYTLKRLRKGAYEHGPYLVLYTRWINEKWDGPLDTYRPWRVYKRASPLLARAFLNSFRTRAEAHRFIAEESVRD